VRDTFLGLQERCRNLESVLNFGAVSDDPALAFKLVEYRKSWIECRNELYVYMEALKNLREQSEKRKSIRPSWKLNVNIGQFDWYMLQDDGYPFCRWKVMNSNFTWVNNEDQSSYNTLEVDAIHLENLMPNNLAGYNDALAALNYDKKDGDNNRQKIIRLIWRENAPVGGIPVVDHFELNISPLLIQITHDFGKALMKYMFIERNTNEEDAKDDNEELNPVLSKTEDTSQELTKRSTTVKKSQKSHLREISAIEISQDFKKNHDMLEMQTRAQECRSFIYIKVPGIDICLSYRGSKEKSLVDLSMVTFHLPTLEYRNKTWTWYDFLQSMKKGALTNCRCPSSGISKHGNTRQREVIQEAHGRSRVFNAPPRRQEQRVSLIGRYFCFKEGWDTELASQEGRHNPKARNAFIDLKHCQWRSSSSPAQKA
jgi:Golgi-body localisation protein domain